MVSKIFNTAILPHDAVETALLSIAPGDDPAKVYGFRLIAQARSGNAYLAAMLISHGADVNTRDKVGMTALHHAAANDARGCIRVLVECGKCDYLIRNNEGRYASDLAIEWAQDYAVGRLLTKHQVRQAFIAGVPAYVKN
ncbi:MAG: ankyrin repeat domain-containing protein [Telluria sp.]